MISFTLKELADRLAAQFVGNPHQVILGVNTLDEASDEDLSFLANPRYLEAMKKSRAGAICVDVTTVLSEGKNFLICENPSAAFQKIAELILLPPSQSAFQGIHPTAVIHESVQIGPNVTIGPHVTIDRGSIIGAGTTLSPNVSIGYEVQIGANCTIYSNCTIRERCRLGDRQCPTRVIDRRTHAGSSVHTTRR